jgi:hypothetical protein
MPAHGNVIERLERADSEELLRLMLRSNDDQERTLRAYLGDERFERMRLLALAATSSGRRGPDGAPRGGRAGNVVLLHGIMGADLETLDNHTGAAEHVWLHYWRILRGNLWKLRLGPDGEREADGRFGARASGIMKKHYGETLLSLAKHFHVRPFWYDWRKDLRVAARDLHNLLEQYYRQGEYVHLVAHSMGGLVARTFINEYPDHWKRLTPANGPDFRGGRLVMLGTPNHGSFAVPQIVTGLEPMVDKLASLDFSHSLAQLLDIINTFPGSYQMLPSPLIDEKYERLYEAKTYAPLEIPQALLDNAFDHHRRLKKVVEPARMLYVAGYRQSTFDRMIDFGRPGARDAYGSTDVFGDGRVPHALGFLDNVQSFFVREAHGSLQLNKLVLAALPDLLSTGDTRHLPTQMPADRGAAPAVPEDDEQAGENAQRLWAQYDAENEESKRIVRQVALRRASRRAAVVVARAAALDRELAPVGAVGAVLSEPAPARPLGGPPFAEAGDDAHAPVLDAVDGEDEIAADAALAEEEVTRGWLGNGRAGRSGGDPGADGADGGGPAAPVGEPIPVSIRVAAGSIAETDGGVASGPAVDAVAVGNYLSVRPQDAILALDRAISAAAPGSAKTDRNAPREHLLLTQYVERGVIRGDLGQTFLLPDPRRPGAVVAVAGMGVAGRFREPELVVLARELCWALGRLGKRHLATVLIGSGRGNLSVAESVESWVEGIAAGLRSSGGEQHGRLAAITFVEFDAGRAREIADILAGVLARRGAALGLNASDDTDQGALRAAAERQARQKELPRGGRRRRREADAKAHANGNGNGDAEGAAEPEREQEQVPTRITLTRERGSFRFGAITPSASIPERVVVIDPALVEEANRLLSTDPREQIQLENGQLIGKLLFPKDFRELYSSKPLVLTLDATTARIHWEMVTQSHVADAPPGGGFRYRNHFLGTAVGLTRQLRTTFAPPPEPPPPARRTLRVLVVADPAADAPLRGAHEEGEAVADLFESFNSVGGPNQVYVRRLIGPRQATRVNVLRELLVRVPGYDVLHFAGHCFFDPRQPARSGWIFTGGQCITASELNRIDRVPGFVFSNACESGITPEREHAASSSLAPSFAEAFFGCGVSNFVCTAWPVDDVAALTFARRFYREMLRLPGSDAAASPRPAYMHEALRAARVAAAGTPAGALTWGAYQHYGNPFYRFFGSDPSPDGADRPAGSPRPAAKPRPPRPAAERAANPRPAAKRKTRAR